MADGKAHYTAWKRSLPLAMGGSVALGLVSLLLGIGTMLGYLLGTVVEPDLDQIGLSSSEGRAMRRFGLIGVFWVMYWMPYAYILPHRSPFSHWPYLGAAIRLVYLLWPVALVLWWFDWPYTLYFEYALIGLIGVWNGLSWADMVHFIMDTRAVRWLRKVFYQ